MGTLTSDPITVLAAHDSWATRKLLETCTKLSREQFHQKFEIGLGSLHDNLTHIVGVMLRWADRVSGRPLRSPIMKMNFPGAPPTPDARDRTPVELLAILGEAEADLKSIIESVRAKGLANPIQVTWPTKDGGKKTYTFSTGAAIVHLYTHGEYHRAQCVNMLRHLKGPGVSDALPDIGVIDWQSQTESPPTLA
jgi:uncharacterized damage-inducible protein DinB